MSTSSSSPMRCKCRRQAETSLRCSRCFVPICPDCSKIVPVGQVCRDCFKGQQSPLFKVSAGSLLAASVVTLLAASLGGWFLTSVGVGFGLLGILWGGFFYGIGVGEVALRMTGRKRGIQMDILAGTCAALGLFAGWVLGAISSGAEDIIAILLRHLMNPMSYALLLWAVVVAVGRIRNI